MVLKIPFPYSVSDFIFGRFQTLFLKITNVNTESIFHGLGTIPNLTVFTIFSNIQKARPNGGPIKIHLIHRVVSLFSTISSENFQPKGKLEFF